MGTKAHPEYKGRAKQVKNQKSKIKINIFDF
jgi:hypothetical protein